MQQLAFVPGLVPSSINTGVTLDASDEGVTVAFIAPRTGNIDRLVFGVETLTGSSPTFRWRLETLGATGNPPRGSGTLYHANGDVTGTVTTNKNVVTFATPVPVTAGDIITVVMTHSSGTIDGSNFIILRASAINGAIQFMGVRGFPCSATFKASTHGTYTAMPLIVPLYDDDYPACSSILLSSSNAAANTTANGEDGNKFTPNFSMDALGFYGFVRYNSGASTVLNFRLYDSSGTVLRSVLSTDGRWGASNSTQSGTFFPFDPITLEAGESYRMGCHNTGSVGRLGWMTFYDAACKNIFYGDLYSEFSRTTRTYSGTWNEGDWTQDATSVSSLLPYVRGINTTPGSNKRITTFFG